MGSESFVPYYDKADRDHLRRLLSRASLIIELIATDQVPFGSYASAELIDSLSAKINHENTAEKDEDELQELKDDSVSLINLYGGVRKQPGFLPLYVQIANLLVKYGLFDELVVLLENAIAENSFNDKDLSDVKQRLEKFRRYRDADDAAMSDSQRIAEELRRALQKKPLDETEIKTLLKQCTDNVMLYDIAGSYSADQQMRSIRERAACLISDRDYQYALASHIRNPARTAMILNLNDTLQEDELFKARTILTDPDYRNREHMLIFCKNETLLMLGWLYVYGVRTFCAERLHNMGSAYPEAYEKMEADERERCRLQLLEAAAEIAEDLLKEDEEVRERIAGRAEVDSEPLYLFLSMHHPRLAKRWWYARQLKNPEYIAYLGSWTSDDQIKEKLSVKINSKELVREMIYGDLSAAEPVFAFRKPEDLSLQDRFCVEIMKNHPDRSIREHVRSELLRGGVEIPGVDLTKPDPFHEKQR